MDKDGNIYAGYIADGLVTKVAECFDRFNYASGYPKNSEGYILFTGNLRYTENYQVTWKKGTVVPYAPKMPATYTEPAGWSDKNTVLRGFKISWNLIDGVQQTQPYLTEIWPKD